MFNPRAIKPSLTSRFTVNGRKKRRKMFLCRKSSFKRTRLELQLQQFHCHFRNIDRNLLGWNFSGTFLNLYSQRLEKIIHECKSRIFHGTPEMAPVMQRGRTGQPKWCQRRCRARHTPQASSSCHFPHKQVLR